jgi:hypothetical protein
MIKLSGDLRLRLWGKAAGERHGTLLWGNGKRRRRGGRG